VEVTQMISLENRPRPWNGVRRERCLPPGGSLLPMRAVLFGLVVPLLLRLRLERLATRLEAIEAPILPGALDRARMMEAREIVRRIDAALREAWPLVRRGCLTRGLTLFWFLRRSGFPVSLRFGIGEVDGRIEGHCWLDLGGEPFAEKRDPRPLYTETWRIPRDGRLEGAVFPLGSLPE